MTEPVERERERGVTMRVRCMNDACPTTMTVVRIERQGAVLLAPALIVCVKCLQPMKVVSGVLRRAMAGG